MNTQLIGISAEVERIRRLIERVSGSGLNVLISGESGVGKEVVASSLYERSPRSGMPFIKVNCAAMPEGLLESELFGYEPGAFTGALKRKRGKFELSSGGVLILDEIGDMPLSLQAKLLLVLQGGEVSPLGSERSIKTDCWTICITNHNLNEDIRHRRFREDLFYRINAINIDIPPLRKRKEDIGPLIDYYLGRYRHRFGVKGELSKSVVKKLAEYDWPGNVRELQNVLQRMLVTDDPENILACLKRDGQSEACFPFEEDLPSVGTRFVETLLKSDPPLADGNELALKIIKDRALYHVEKRVIRLALEKTQWNRIKAAKLLKISYKSLLDKIKEFEIYDT